MQYVYVFSLFINAKLYMKKPEVIKKKWLLKFTWPVFFFFFGGGWGLGERRCLLIDALHLFIDLFFFSDWSLPVFRGGTHHAKEWPVRGRQPAGECKWRPAFCLSAFILHPLFFTFLNKSSSDSLHFPSSYGKTILIFFSIVHHYSCN